MFSSSSPRSRRLAPRRKRAYTPTLGVTAFFALCIYSLTFTFTIKLLHKEADNVGLRSEYEPDERDAPATHSIEIHKSVTLRSTNVTKLSTTVYEAGQFCDHCAWKGRTLCGERLEYLVTYYGANETEARESLMKDSSCIVPTIHHKVYTEENEPSIILHVGPHKTGTTALQSFIYELAKSNNTIFLKDNIRIPTTKESYQVFTMVPVQVST